MNTGRFTTLSVRRLPQLEVPSAPAGWLIVPGGLAASWGGGRLRFMFPHHGGMSLPVGGVTVQRLKTWIAFVVGGSIHAVSWRLGPIAAMLFL